ncbi:MAG: BlaI/MecI/CopY family transcriptional regulator [Candidatus Aminicenantes bacterium]|nr:BlaI/MecI/CopY family transcriptional regulator [Candidatus Aminicenantes bacterium]
MKELTRAEEQIMQILWKLDRGFVKDIIDDLPVPKPAYNTVSTIIRILEKKGVVSHKAYGNTHEYFALITKDEYKKKYFKSFLMRYFGDSFPDMVSFFAGDRDLSLQELEEIRQRLGEEIEKQKGEGG